MDVQLHRLEGFYHVARVGGYAKAARDFPYPISQPAVHQQVKKLEEELGRRLFERVGRDRLVLTPAGQALWEFASPYFEALPSVVRAIRADAVSGELRVWSEPLMTRRLLPAWIGRVRDAVPDIDIDLREVRSPDLDCLRRGDADLLIAYMTEVSDDIDTRVVSEVRPFVALPESHAVAQAKRVPWKKLAELTFIGYERDLLPFELQLRALAAQGIEPRRVISVTSADAILAFVAQGLGYSIVPSLSPTGPRVDGVQVRQLSKPARSFPVHAAWRKSAWENPLVAAFLNEAPER